MIHNIPIVVKMVVAVQEDVPQRKDVAVVATMDVVLEDVSPFAIVFVSLEDAAKGLVVQKDVVLVLIIKECY